VVQDFANDLKHGVLSAKLDKSMAFKYSICEKFWPKFQEGSKNIPVEAITILVKPFLYLLARGKDKTLLARIEEYIFDPLIPGQIETETPIMCDIECMINETMATGAAKSTAERNRGRLYGIHSKFEGALMMLADMSGDENEDDEEEEGEEEDEEEFEDDELAQQMAEEGEEEEDEDEDEEDDIEDVITPGAAKAMSQEMGDDSEDEDSDDEDEEAAMREMMEEMQQGGKRKQGGKGGKGSKGGKGGGKGGKGGGKKAATPSNKKQKRR